MIKSDSEKKNEEDFEIVYKKYETIFYNKFLRC